MMDIKALFVENCHAANMRSMITVPIQNAEKLPATKPRQDVQGGAAMLRAVGHFDMSGVGADEDLGELGESTRPPPCRN